MCYGVCLGLKARFLLLVLPPLFVNSGGDSFVWMRKLQWCVLFVLLGISVVEWLDLFVMVGVYRD